MTNRPTEEEIQRLLKEKVDGARYTLYTNSTFTTVRELGLVDVFLCSSLGGNLYLNCTHGNYNGYSGETTKFYINLTTGKRYEEFDVSRLHRVEPFSGAIVLEETDHIPTVTHGNLGVYSTPTTSHAHTNLYFKNTRTGVSRNTCSYKKNNIFYGQYLIVLAWDLHGIEIIDVASMFEIPSIIKLDVKPDWCVIL